MAEFAVMFDGVQSFESDPGGFTLTKKGEVRLLVGHKPGIGEPAKLCEIEVREEEGVPHVYITGDTTKAKFIVGKPQPKTKLEDPDQLKLPGTENA